MKLGISQVPLARTGPPETNEQYVRYSMATICKEKSYFAARASATATLQLYDRGSSIPPQSPLKHLNHNKNTTFSASASQLQITNGKSFKIRHTGIICISPLQTTLIKYYIFFYLLSNGWIVVVTTPATLECPQAVCACV